MNIYKGVGLRIRKLLIFEWIEIMIYIVIELIVRNVQLKKKGINICRRVYYFLVVFFVFG